MLRRFCDRCAAEMPMEQTMGDDELILRRLNEKPYDLCPVCQDGLQSWMKREWTAAGLTMRIVNGKTESENKCSCYHVEWGGVPHCWGTKENEVCDCDGDERRCNFYLEKREGHDDKRNDNAE